MLLNQLITDIFGRQDRHPPHPHDISKWVCLLNFSYFWVIKCSINLRQGQSHVGFVGRVYLDSTRLCPVKCVGINCFACVKSQRGRGQKNCSQTQLGSENLIQGSTQAVTCSQIFTWVKLRPWSGRGKIICHSQRWSMQRQS